MEHRKSWLSTLNPLINDPPLISRPGVILSRPGGGLISRPALLQGGFRHLHSFCFTLIYLWDVVSAHRERRQARPKNRWDDDLTQSCSLMQRMCDNGWVSVTRLLYYIIFVFPFLIRRAINAVTVIPLITLLTPQPIIAVIVPKL